MSFSKRKIIVLAAAFVVVCFLALKVFPSQELSVGKVAIYSESGKHIFNVEIPSTKEAKENGLMFRKELSKDSGMLFKFSPPQQVSIWMKNTYISLDVLFVDGEGQIIKIYENAPPLSFDIMSSNSRVSMVLEINAGRSAELGIKEGDELSL
ncbi:MAG: DUF192 domain-containing protein [Alphaproteobacteria bacterium]|nr:DUF192 domain-containing protein [Alphaproteobacteria bacterium]